MKGWIPIKLKEINELLLCEWIYVGSNHFMQPFFEEENLSCYNYKNNPRLLKSYTDLNILVNTVSEIEESPTAIIFHVSRCGSTLAAQMLAEDENNAVLSENPFINDLLVNKNKVEQQYPDIGWITVFKKALIYFGSYRFNSKKGCLLKLRVGIL